MTDKQQFPKVKLLVCSLFNILLLFSQNLNSQSLNHRQGQLIVQLKSGFGWESDQRNSFVSRSKGLVQTIKPLKKLGPSWNIWLIAFDFSKISESKLIQEMQLLPEVLNVQLNHLLKPRTIPNDPFFNSQWYHLNSQNPLFDFDSDKAWDLTTGGLTENGDTIVLCIIDEGLDIKHEDLSPNLWINSGEIPGNGLDDDQNGYVDDRKGWNTYTKNDTFDIGKHGTPVAGLAAARGNNSKGVAGICWNVKIMFVEGGSDEANAVESYAYPLNQRRLYNQSNGKKGAFVVATNSSWGLDYGQPSEAPIWCAMYDSLGTVGIINVASTANLNIDVDVDGDLPTGCESEFLIAVTSMNDQNAKDPAAAYGKKSVDLGAYGENVYTAYINNTYRSFSGTSAASPQVAGAVALIYSLSCNNLSFLSHSDPPEAAREVKRILLNSVRANSDLKNNTVSGGVLNLFQALQTTSPLILNEITTNSISFKWTPNILFPIYIRYRIANQNNWNDTTIYSGVGLKLSNLDVCTEYELQYKNICSRNTNNYSPSRIYKTFGCCDAPSEFKIVKNTGNEIDFNYKDEGTGSLIGMIRLSGTTLWDTFVIPSNQGQFALYNLDFCAQYEFTAYTFCNNRPTPLSIPFTFNTPGCSNCSDLNYCKRYKPSSDLEWIDAIKVDNVIFKSGNNLGYGNYVGSNQSWTFEKNKSYSFTIQAGYLNDTSHLVAAAWIDYNQDGNFDDNENFAMPAAKFTNFQNYMLSIPANAKTGMTRMRICVKFADFSAATPLPCFQSLEFGEYEDYCVMITNSICTDIDSIQLTSMQPDQVTLSLTDTSSNSFIYVYRKLYDLDWNFGFASSKTILINQLDSCSRYEIKLQSVCTENRSNPLYFKFNTSGTGCITSTHESNADKIFIAPNPFSNQIFINNPNNKTIHSVSIYSVGGNVILKQKLESNQSIISLSCITTPGFYMMQLMMADGRSKVFRLISQ